MKTLYMAMRLSASGDGKKSTPAVKVAIAAVALSVAVMLAAIAIVMGFKEEITRKVIGFNPHIVIKASQHANNDDVLVSLTPSTKAVLDSLPYMTEYSLSASVPAIFKPKSEFKGVYLKAGNDERLKDFLRSQLVSGKIPDFDNDSSALVISDKAARQLELKVGDELPTYFITDEVKVRPLKIRGIYNSHFDTYDDIYAFGPMSLIQEIGGLGKAEGTYINMYVDDFSRVSEYARDIQQRLLNAYSGGIIYKVYDVETALTSGANFFSWLSLLDTNVVVVLVLMTAVALITLISGMMIIIVDKKRFIAIMKVLGAPNKMLRKIFVILTLRVAVVGLLIGNILMLALLFWQASEHVIPLDPESYYIDFVPVKITWESIVILNVAILVISYIMLLLPSRFVSSISPARSLQSE